MLERPIHFRGESGEEQCQCHVTIDILPNDVLLEIFSLYQELNPSDLSWWQTFVHVCQRWRHTILESPLRLHLVLVCNHRTPVRKSLNIWPPFPIAVHHHNPRNTDGDRNIVAALEHRDRVSEISLIRSEMPQRLAPLALIHKPFLSLTYLRLVPNGNTLLSEAFLGGCTPSLRTVIFEGLSFPALPKLLLSATHLITLQLWRIPITGYISPGAMAACLVFLPNLKHLCIEFQSPRSSPYQTDPLLFTRAVHPALTSFHFNGASRYLEDLVARIDTPILDTLSTTFSDLVIRIPQLHRFISHVERFKPPIRAVLQIDASSVYLKFIPSENYKLGITTCAGLMLSMALVCRELSPFLSHVEHLDIRWGRVPGQLSRQIDMDPVLWLELFRPFIAVQSLYVSMKLESFVVSALQELSATEVLPELRTLFLDELQQSRYVRRAIEPFLAARQLMDHPVAIKQWQLGQ